MKRFLRGGVLLGLLLLLALTATGCGDSVRLTISPQDLYRLPKLPAKYTELNKQLNLILEEGAEYAAPTSGTNIQPVQLIDLDGDGREEALAFFRNTADEKPLKICIFTTDGDTYELTASIEGSGTAFYSVAYSDLDGDGRMELLVGWKVTEALQALSVYTLRPAGTEELIRSTSYVKYAVTNLDQDQRQELVVLHADDEGNGIADYYSWRAMDLAVEASARISMNMAELSGQQGQVLCGTLQDGTPALFVTGVAESSRAVTDVLAVKDSEFTNIMLSAVTGVSSEISLFRGLYPTDINGDGITEVPWAVPMPTWDDEEESAYHRIDWRTYDISGNAATALTTYHNMEDGWYLRLPESWEGRVLVSRSAVPEEASVTFYAKGGNGDLPAPFLRITALTGTNRESKAVRGNRFHLIRRKETIYVAELLDTAQNWEDGLTEDEVRAAFNLITTGWTAGDN